MKSSHPKFKRDAFWERLQRLGGARSPDRGALAALRRGLGRQPGTVAGMHRYVAWALPNEQWTWENRTYYVVAALYASHPQSAEHGNFGDTFRQIYAARKNSDSIEKRFVALLNCHRDDLTYHLRQAVGLARSSDVAVNWPKLHGDIIFWDHESGHTKRDWARSFWARQADARDPAESNANSITSGT